MQARFLIVVLLGIMFAAEAESQCTRLKFYGSPVNLIHQAHEYIDALLQYANVNTNVFYVGSYKTFDIATGTTDNFLFQVLGPNGQNKAIFLRIVTYKNRQFLSEYGMFDAVNVATLDFFLARFGDTTLAPIFGNQALYPDCTLLKDEYTYFYTLYPSRTKKEFH